MLCEAISAVREIMSESEAGLAQPASSRRFRTPTASTKTHEIFAAPPPVPLTATIVYKGPPLEVSNCFPDVPADKSADGLVIASGVVLGLAWSERGPYLVGGLVTLNDASVTAKNRHT